MSVTLAHNTYGRQAVRLIKVGRRADRDEIKDVTVSVGLDGEFGAAYTSGDASRVLSMSDIQSAVYALAAQHPVEPIEAFGAALGHHLLERCPPASQARVEIAERPWARLVVHERPHPHAFALDKSEVRTAAVTTTREFSFVEAGVDGLAIVKNLHPAPAGDEGTPAEPPAGGGRLLATELRAIWLYADSDLAFDGCWRGIRQMLLDVFAEHRGDSLQETLYAMGSAAMEMFEEILEIRLAMPDNGCVPVETTTSGTETRNGIYVPTDEPFGLVEATVRRR
jgi:urate oxidase